jgi:hypothetical protein
MRIGPNIDELLPLARDCSELPPPPPPRWKKPQVHLLRFGSYAPWLKSYLMSAAPLSFWSPLKEEETAERLARLKRYLLQELEELTNLEELFWNYVLRGIHIRVIHQVFGRNFVSLYTPFPKLELVRLWVDLSGLREAYRGAGFVGKRKRGRPPGEWTRAKIEGRWVYQAKTPCKVHPKSMHLTRNRRCRRCTEEERADWEASPAAGERYAERHREQIERELRYVAYGMLWKAANRRKASLKKHGRLNEANILEARLASRNLKGLEKLLSPKARKEWDRYQRALKATRKGPSAN